MRIRIRAYNFATLVLLAPLWCASCKDSEPTPMLAQDLGTQGEPLVLPPATFQNVRINTGQADWVPFREPGSEPEPAFDSQAEGTSAEDGQPEESPAVVEIKTFIVDYNELSDEGDFEEMGTYILESQSESMTAAFAGVADVRKKIGELKTQLSSELGDQTDRIESTLAKISDSVDLAMGARLSVVNISIANKDEATATTVTGSLTTELKFVVVDFSWYLEFPELADAETLTEQLTSQVNTYNNVIAQLSDGTLTAEQVLSNMEQTLAAATASNESLDESDADTDDVDGETEDNADDSLDGGTTAEDQNED